MQVVQLLKLKAILFSQTILSILFLVWVVSPLLRKILLCSVQWSRLIENSQSYGALLFLGLLIRSLWGSMLSSTTFQKMWTLRSLFLPPLASQFLTKTGRSVVWLLRPFIIVIKASSAIAGFVFVDEKYRVYICAWLVWWIWSQGICQSCFIMIDITLIFSSDNNVPVVDNLAPIENLYSVW